MLPTLLALVMLVVATGPLAQAAGDDIVTVAEDGTVEALTFTDQVDGNVLIVDPGTQSFEFLVGETGAIFAGVDEGMRITRQKIVMRYRADDLSFFLSANVDLVRNSARATLLDRTGPKTFFHRLYQKPTNQRTPGPTPTITPGPRPTRTPKARTRLIVIDNYSFKPRRIVIPINTTIVWVNRSSVGHTTTEAEGEWDSGELATGEEFAFKVITYTSYAHQCDIHPYMHGQIVVK